MIHDKLGRQASLDNKDTELLENTRTTLGNGMNGNNFSSGLSSTEFIIKDLNANNSF